MPSDEHPTNPAPLILMYHRVIAKVCDPWGLCVSPENFKAQMEMLKEERRIVPLAWMVSEIREGRLPSGCVAITFDDGYADVLLHGLPVLETLEFPSTIFLVTGAVDTRGFWWDVLSRILLGTEARPEPLVLTVGGVEHRWRIRNGKASEEEPRAALWPEEVHLEVWRLLRGVDVDTRQELLGQLATWAGTHANELEEDRVMTAGEIGKLSQGGLVDFQAHSVSHASLPMLDEGRQRIEILDSQRACGALTGRPVRGFSYPFGDFDATSEACVRSGAFDYACTTTGGSLSLDSDPFRLARMTVNDWDGTEFEKQLQQFA